MQFKNMTLDQIAHAGSVNGRQKKYPVLKMAAAIRIAAACRCSDILAEYIEEEKTMDEIAEMLKQAQQIRLSTLHEDNNTLK
jgi:hypothetical protein